MKDNSTKQIEKRQKTREQRNHVNICFGQTSNVDQMCLCSEEEDYRRQ